MKNVSLALVLASLLFAGAGCATRPVVQEKQNGQEKYAQLTSEQKSACQNEIFAVSMDTAVIPEDPSSADVYAAKLLDSCYAAAEKPPAFHLIKFSKGADSEIAGQELLDGLKNIFYMLEACKAYGMKWTLPAQRQDSRARFECRVRCAKDASGGVSCEDTVYRGLLFVPPPATNQ